MTRAKVEQLHTNATKTEVKLVEAVINGDKHLFSAELVIVSCGTVNSAALLLRSANDAHPGGLVNSSDKVGHNYRQISSSLDFYTKSDRP